MHGPPPPYAHLDRVWVDLELVRMASGLVNAYLLMYNGLLSVGWLLVLYPAVRYTATHTDSLTSIQGFVPELYSQMQWPLLIFQTAAVMEVNTDRKYNNGA